MDFLIQDGIIKSNTNIYVPWSGGQDSTFLLCKLADYLLKTNINCTIILVTVYSSQLYKFKSKREKQARKKLISIIMDKYPNIIFYTDSLHLKNDIDYDDEQAGIQHIAWTLLAYSIKRDSVVLFGYNRADLNESDQPLINMLTDQKQLFDKITSSLGKPCEVVYPILHTGRKEISAYLESQGLLHLTTWCSRVDDNNEPCGECKPCLNRNHD